MNGCQIGGCGHDAYAERVVKVHIAALVVDATLVLCERHACLVDGNTARLNELGNMRPDLDLPFLPVADPTPGPLVAEYDVAGGVVCEASVIDVPELGPLPAVGFRFCRPDGVFARPVLFVAPADQVRKLPGLVGDAATAAVMAASR